MDRDVEGRIRGGILKDGVHGSSTNALDKLSSLSCSIFRDRLSCHFRLASG